MLSFYALTASTYGASIPPDEQQRIGVYVLAAIFGLLVTGIIACSKELRRDLADKKLRQAREQEAAGRTALNAVAREMKAA
jgi:hypothetical protein